MSSVAAFVLAGGKSTRMGEDKALLILDGRTLIEHALDIARGASQDVSIVGEPAKFSPFGNPIPDLRANCGPLGGIHAALSRTSAELNFIIAVDTPFVPAAFVRYLIAQAQTSGAVLTCARIHGQFQPLCAVYRREFLTCAEAALESGKYKIDPLFAQVSTRIIGDDELAKLGLSAAIFDNLNTPLDWKRATDGDRAQRRHD